MKIREYIGNIYVRWTGCGIYHFLNLRKTVILYCLFVIAALTQGITYSFLFPPEQVPDEIAHYEMIEEEFGTDGYAEELKTGLFTPGGYDAMPWHYDIKVNYKAAESVESIRFTKPLMITDFHPTIMIVRHLPAGIGFYLGIGFGLPILTCTYMAEIFSVLFFVAIGFLVIRTAPVKKEIFAFCLLLPESLQQCASVSYDAVTIPVAFLLFAYVLRLYEQEKLVRWKQVFCVGGLSLVLLIVKPPYALIALTLLMIPADRFNLKIGKRIELAHIIRKYWYVVLFVIVIAGGLIIYALRDNSLIKTIIADVLSIGDFARMLTRTFRQLGYEYLYMMVGVFGWIDSRVSASFLILVYGMMVWLNTARVEKPTREINIGRRALLLAIFVLSLLVILVALQEWSYQALQADVVSGVSVFRVHINNLESIIGFQGRYVIPLLPVLLVALSGTARRKNTYRYWLVQGIYYIYAFVTVINILQGRYWA